MNALLDACDMLAGTSPDVNGNGRPAECDECSIDADCDDTVFCNGTENCANGTCRSAGDPCVGQGLTCNEASRACVCLIDTDCDDGLFCTGIETCIDGACMPGAKPCISEGLA